MKHLIPVLLLTLYSCSSSDPIPFNAKEWKQNKEDRYLMVEDILERDLFVGKTKAQIQQLLGKEDDERTHENSIAYFTNKPIEGFCLDQYVLEIHFDTLNRVMRADENMW